MKNIKKSKLLFRKITSPWLKLQLLALLLFSFVGSSIAQNQIAKKLDVRITDHAYLPVLKGEGPDQSFTFTHPDLAQLLANYTIINFKRTYPTADAIIEHRLGEPLTRVYEIEIAESEVDLYYDLITSGTEFFDRVNYKYEDFPLSVTPNDFTTLGYPSGEALDLIKIRKAWMHSKGSTNIKIAITETGSTNGFDIGHEDFVNANNSSQIAFTHSGVNTSPSSDHGTCVASIAGAATGNSIGMTGAGYKCRLMLYNSVNGSMHGAILQAAIDGADIINCSWASCSYNQNNQDIITSVVDTYGCIIIAGAANGNQGNIWCLGGPSVGFPDNQGNYRNDYAYPASYTGVFSVGGSTLQDDYEQGTTTHTFNDRVDITAPGFNVTCALPNDNYNVSGGWGTSFAAPLTCGVAGLLLHKNSCFAYSSVLDVIKSTTDNLYDDSQANAAYTGYAGTGRLNAHAALVAAQNYFSSSMDLYIKDRPEDLGLSGGYHWLADRDNSPDIWVRNQADGYENQEHQDPEYQALTPVYIYVRVRNKSCVASTGNENLAVYWTKASSWASWPQNWDGSQPTIGGQVSSIPIPVIPPGEEVILEFPWSILNPNVHNTWSSCLLARIEGSSVDPITVYPNKVNDDVYFNNNISWKNLTVVDLIAGKTNPGGLDGIGFSDLHTVGTTIFVGNPTSSDETYTFAFQEDVFSSNPLHQVAEIKVLFEDQGWSFMEPLLTDRASDGILITGDREVTLQGPSFMTSEVLIPANTRFPIHVGVNFLTDEHDMSERGNYRFHVRQFNAENGELLGGEHFSFNRHDRVLFNANGGGDVTIHQGEAAEVEGIRINEDAVYKWYDEANEVLSESNVLAFSPSNSTTIKYEVTSKSDGYKDYDEVTVTVIEQWINSVSPNPVAGLMTVSYHAPGAAESILSVTNILSNQRTDYEVDPIADGVKEIDMSGAAPGSYQVQLICDGNTTDTKTIVVK